MMSFRYHSWYDLFNFYCKTIVAIWLNYLNPTSESARLKLIENSNNFQTFLPLFVIIEDGFTEKNINTKTSDVLGLINMLKVNPINSVSIWLINMTNNFLPLQVQLQFFAANSSMWIWKQMALHSDKLVTTDLLSSVRFLYISLVASQLRGPIVSQA